jgi:uncharacterized membrane protein YqjE
VNSYVNHEKNGKSLSAIINELKLEFREFAQTRYQILQAEMKEKLAAWKTGIPLMVTGLLFALVGFLLLTGALVVVVAIPLGVGWALTAVGLAYLILAGVMGWIGYAEISHNQLKPERTLRVLKEDQIWIQNQARSV